MARLYDKAFFGDAIVSIEDARVSVASSAVLYGLSVYTVLPVCATDSGPAAFRVHNHYRRLINSARIIGIDTFESAWPEARFLETVRTVVSANAPKGDVFVRVTIHVTDLLPGTRSRGLTTVLSAFMSDAAPIVPQSGARLKTSAWRRTADDAIPSRAKVNGAYINSVLGKQDALDSGYDDCIFLDGSGHVCELSAANIFLVRDGVLLTPDTSSDILEGITRATILELADAMKIDATERSIDLTELYIADEVFACGTSAYIAPVVAIDGRPVGDGKIGKLTERLKARYTDVLHGKNPEFKHLLTMLK